MGCGIVRGRELQWDVEWRCGGIQKGQEEVGGEIVDHGLEG